MGALHHAREGGFHAPEGGYRAACRLWSAGEDWGAGGLSHAPALAMEPMFST